MKGRVIKLLIMTIIVCLVLLGCNKAPPLPNTNRWSKSDSIIMAMEDSYVVVDHEARLEGDYLIYRYYPSENKSEDIGAVNDFVMTYGRPIQVGDYLYMFVSSAEGSTVTEHLYKINLKDNSLTSLYKQPNNYPLSPVALLSGDVVFLGVNQNSDGSLTTRLYHQEKSDSEYRCAYEMQYAADSTGEAMVHLSASGNIIYTLTRVSSANADAYAIDVFDSSFKHQKRIFLSDDFGDIHTNQRITKFEVVGDYAFIRTTSNGFLGCLKEDSVDLVMQHKMLDMAYNPSHQYEGECVFYLMREQEWYSLNLTNGEVSKMVWNLGNERIINFVLAANSGYLVNHYIDDQGNIMDAKIDFITEFQ